MEENSNEISLNKDTSSSDSESILNQACAKAKDNIDKPSLSGSQNFLQQIGSNYQTSNNRDLDTKICFSKVESEQVLSEDDQFKLFSKSEFCTPLQDEIKEKINAPKLTFKRSPTLGKKTKSYSDNFKKMGKMYLSDEDGAGDEASIFRGDEDERNYCSETELDALCNQSDSIEADQYKMDPEADQMKSEFDNVQDLLATERIHKNITPQTDMGGVTQFEETETINDSQTISNTQQACNDLFTNHQSSTVKLQTASKKQVYDHPAITESLQFLFNYDRKRIVSNVENLRCERDREIQLNEIRNKIDTPHVSSSLIKGVITSANEKQELRNTDIEMTNLLVENRNDKITNDEINQHLPMLRESFEDAEKIEQQIHKLLQLSNKHLSERMLYDEATEFNDNNLSNLLLMQKTNQLSQHDRGLLTKYKELLPFSHKYLMDIFEEGDIFEQTNKANLSSLMADNKVLQTSLEEQTFRRKHCEKQLAIHHKQVLELQQMMAVAVSMDRMKDDAIKGIDEMLCRSVRRWKGREEDQWTLLEKVAAENKSMKGVMNKQQDTLLKYESQFKDLSKKLKEEKDKNEKDSKSLIKQLQDAQENLAFLEEEKNFELRNLMIKLEEEQSSGTNLERELEGRLSDMKNTFEFEQLKWRSKESKLEEEIKMVRNDCSERINLEKMRSDKLQNIIEELNLSLKQLNKETSRMETEVNKLKHEKEGLAVDMESLEDKYKQQLSEVQKESSNKARNEVAEVTQKLVELHKWEINEVMRTHMDEVEVVKRDCNDRCNVAFIKLSGVMDEMKVLKEENEMLINFKKNAAGRMQLMLQVHQQEALKLFGVDVAIKDSMSPVTNVDYLSGPQDSKSFVSQQISEENLGSGFRSIESQSNLNQEQKRYALELDDDDEYSYTLLPLPAKHSTIGHKRKNTDLQLKTKSYNNNQLKQNKNGKTPAHSRTSNRAENNSGLPNGQLDFQNLSLVPVKNYSQNTPPTRLDGHAKDLPTNDIQRGAVESQYRNNDNNERSNVLRQYIKMMLQEDPNVLSKDNQNSMKNHGFQDS